MIMLEGLKFKLVFEEQKLKGVYIIRPEIYNDDRDIFLSPLKLLILKNLNIDFVQDNEVLSKNTKIIRGLHYQIENLNRN